MAMPVFGTIINRTERRQGGLDRTEGAIVLAMAEEDLRALIAADADLAHVASSLAKFQRLLEELVRPRIIAQKAGRNSEVAQGIGLAGAVAERPVERPALRQRLAAGSYVAQA